MNVGGEEEEEEEGAKLGGMLERGKRAEPVTPLFLLWLKMGPAELPLSARHLRVLKDLPLSR